MIERIQSIIGNRAWQSAVVLTEKLVFSDAVIKACEQNYCGKFGTCWTCPPANGTLEQNKQKICSYKYAFVFTTKHDLEDSFDYEGMESAKIIHDNLTREVFKSVKTPVYGAGGCTVCAKCAYPNECLFPHEVIYSLEGSGINVAELSKTANINYINGANTVTYFSFVLL